MGDHTFRSDKTLTCAQVAKIIVLVFDLHVSKSAFTLFTDTMMRQSAIKSLVDSGITQGTMASNDPVNRGQLVTFLYRILKLESENMHVASIE